MARRLLNKRCSKSCHLRLSPGCEERQVCRMICPMYVPKPVGTVTHGPNCHPQCSCLPWSTPKSHMLMTWCCCHKTATLASSPEPLSKPQWSPSGNAAGRLQPLGVTEIWKQHRSPSMGAVPQIRGSLLIYPPIHSFDHHPDTCSLITRCQTQSQR